MGILSAWANAYPDVATWSSTAGLMTTVTQLVSPFCAGAAAWTGIRAFRRSMQATEATSALNILTARAPQLFSALAWVAAAWFVVFIVTIVRATLTGLFGTPNAVVLLQSFATPLLWTIIGFGVAQLIRNWLAIVISSSACLAFYVSTFIPGAPPLVGALGGLVGYGDTDMTAPNSVFYLGSLISLVGVATVVICAWTLRSGSPRFAPLAVGVVSLAVIVAGGGVIVGQNSRPSIVLEDAELTFVEVQDDATGLRMHVLEHYEPVSPQLIKGWARVAVLVDGSELGFEQLRQAVDVDHEGAANRFDRLYLNPALVDSAADSIQSSLYDVLDCYAGNSLPQGNFGLEGTIAVENWFMDNPAFAETWVGNPDVTEALSWLFSLDQTEANRWVEEHQDNIRSCTWDEGSFGIS